MKKTILILTTLALLTFTQAQEAEIAVHVEEAAILNEEAVIEEEFTIEEEPGDQDVLGFSLTGEPDFNEDDADNDGTEGQWEKASSASGYYIPDIIVHINITPKKWGLINLVSLKGILFYLYSVVDLYGIMIDIYSVWLTWE